MSEIVNKDISRSEEITTDYFSFLDQHIEDVISGKVSDFMLLAEIADKLNISHKHLTDTIQKEMSHHPCYFYDMKIIDRAQGLLKDHNLSVAEIARMFTYDPSNFTKFFKKMVGETPKIWRLKNEN